MTFKIQIFLAKKNFKSPKNTFIALGTISCKIIILKITFKCFKFDLTKCLTYFNTISIHKSQKKLLIKKTQKKR